MVRLWRHIASKECIVSYAVTDFLYTYLHYRIYKTDQSGIRSPPVNLELSNLWDDIDIPLSSLSWITTPRYVSRRPVFSTRCCRGHSNKRSRSCLLSRWHQTMSSLSRHHFHRRWLCYIRYFQLRQILKCFQRSGPWSEYRWRGFRHQGHHHRSFARW